MPNSAEECRQASIRLLAMSRKWWESLRPVDWDVGQHLDNPTVNTSSGAETELAEAIAGAIKAGVFQVFDVD